MLGTVPLWLRPSVEVDSAHSGMSAHPAENGASGEANLVLPDLSSVSFMGMDGHSLLMIGLIFCALGLIFGLLILRKLKNMPVHRSMREISELIYETCKTYLITQGKFLAFFGSSLRLSLASISARLRQHPGHPVGLNGNDHPAF